MNQLKIQKPFNIKRLCFILVMCAVFAAGIQAQEKTESFASQNKKSYYTSVAVGMGIDYGSNNSLNDFIGYEIPNYATLSDDQKLSDFKAGFEFFGSVERQVAKRFAVKLDYSYFAKSNNISYYPNYEFNYNNHQIMLSGLYIIPMEYSFFKIGLGVGKVFSDLSVKSAYTNGDFKSDGFMAKLEGNLNLQLGKNLAGYISGYMANTFNDDVENDAGEKIGNGGVTSVNLDSFMFGLRLGIEVYIF
ncbi:MAG: hypothetical protein L0Y76_08075 [Ignavibacteria bacterium]|nr:hypothetical protein [Ignavibacteria bacterium]